MRVAERKDMDDRGIGVFDSGLGGLTVWREIRRQLPEESLLYYGDGKNCPYGPRPTAEVCRFASQAVRFLIEKGAKLIVVACNAATAAAIDYLRATYSLPIVGMEPAVKPAVLTTERGVVGILATAAALEGPLFHRTAGQYADRATILTAVGEGFVELVERNAEQSPEALETVRRAVEPLLLGGADRIVLGCTHYPFLIGPLRQVIGERTVGIIDPAPAVARRVGSLLDSCGLRAPAGHVAEYDFYTASDDTYLQRLVEKSRIALQEVLNEEIIRL